MDEVEQYRIVHSAVQAIAAHCDGAQERDGIGFDGSDTKYGRRIAGVAFEKLTQDDHEEEARIVVKYRKQALAWTGVEVTDLPVVIAAQDLGTNYASRENARRAEKLAGAKTTRTATLTADGKVALAWSKKDPEFGLLLPAVQALPGRSFDWDTKTNRVPATDALLAFLDEWDINVADEVIAAVKTEIAKPAPVVVNVDLLNDKTIKIVAPFISYDKVADAKALPGRWWNPTAKWDEVSLSVKVLEFAAKWGLNVSAEAREACVAAAAQEEAEAARKAAQGDTKSLLTAASRAKDINDLPESFWALASAAVVAR